MRKSAFFLCLMFMTLSIWANEEPMMLRIATTSNVVELPVAGIQKITYDKAGTTMYVQTSEGTNSYEVATITQMTLTNGTNPTGISDSPIHQLTNSYKFEKGGVVYVVKDGKIYTMKGDKL